MLGAGECLWQVDAVILEQLPHLRHFRFEVVLLVGGDSVLISHGSDLVGKHGALLFKGGGMGQETGVLLTQNLNTW